MAKRVLCSQSTTNKSAYIGPKETGRKQIRNKMANNLRFDTSGSSKKRNNTYKTKLVEPLAASNEDVLTLAV